MDNEQNKNQQQQQEPTDETIKQNAGTEPAEQAGNDGNQGVDQHIDADKALAKLQKRIGKEQAEKNDYKSQLEAAKKQLEALKSGKSIKDMSDEDKKKQDEAEKDKQIKALQAKLHRTEVAQSTRDVLSEAGLAVTPDVLNMIVVDDDKATYANAKALIDFANAQQEVGRTALLKGRTPKASGKPAKAISAEAFDKMSFAERAKLAKDDPEQFKKLTGGL